MEVEKVRGFKKRQWHLEAIAEIRWDRHLEVVTKGRSKDGFCHEQVAVMRVCLGGETECM